ncbi:MAG TPA: TadE/TadG family type IV pilus assembly protein [Stellaceae bacterium]|nr:TadE/TadG family type IV pilus assembly protein [Stellaceae bacterium]
MGRIRRFLRDLGEDGVAVIEFGLIGSAYILMLVAAIEVGYMLFVQAALDNAARDAARQIRTGQVQTAGNPANAFKTLLCNDLGSLIPCASLVYQSTSFWNWSSAQSQVDAPLTRDKNGNVVGTGFDGGGSSGEIEVVQVTYNYPFFTPWIGSLLGGSTGSALLVSTVVFQNEPY